jgi:hypothetical protein
MSYEHPNAVILKAARIHGVPDTGGSHTLRYTPFCIAVIGTAKRLGPMKIGAFFTLTFVSNQDGRVYHNISTTLRRSVDRQTRGVGGLSRCSWSKLMVSVREAIRKWKCTCSRPIGLYSCRGKNRNLASKKRNQPLDAAETRLRLGQTYT